MTNRRNTLYLVTIVSLLTGLFTGRAEIFNIAYLIAALMFLSYLWTWLSLREIALQRHTRTRRSQVGRVFRESFAVRKLGILPTLWLEIRDHSKLPNHHASHIVPSLYGGREYSWEVETICSVRGEFQLGPMTIMSGDPFGLFHSPRQISAIEQLIVYPMIVELNRVILPVGFLSGGDAQRKLTHQVTTNASGIRDYIPGDSMNRIHWRSTARAGNIMVKEFELDPLVDIWLLSDFSSDSFYQDTGSRHDRSLGNFRSNTGHLPPSTEEYAAVVGASLAKHFIDDERVLGYVTNTPALQIFEPDRGDRQLTKILQTLAVARSTSDHTLQKILSLESHRFTRGTILMIVTSSLDSAWVRELQVLKRRGIRPTCVFIDPHTFEPQLDSMPIRGMLQLARIPTLVVSKDDDIAAALQQRPQ